MKRLGLKEHKLFKKRLSELTREDIERVVTEAVQEGAEVEFKSALPAKSGSSDPWLDGCERIGDRARNEIVEEVVAFANAYGGTLVIGISETADKPSRAASISPIPQCAELAERLRLQLRDCIEPQIPIVEVAGISTEPDGSGVVVIRLPSSRMAPHRHTVRRECYIRRADRSEKMTMREIQDLTLQVERGLAAIKATFDARRERFAERFKAFTGDSEQAFCMRATLVPLVPISVKRVHNNESVRPPLHKFLGILEGNQIEIFLPVYGGGSWRPILRGTKSTESSNDFVVERELYCDGLIEYLVLVKKDDASPLRLYPGWFMGMVGNALFAAERFRRVAEVPEVEIGLEVEVTNCGESLAVGKYGGASFGDWLGPFPEGRTIFPRYSIGPCDEFQALCSLVETDFWHAAGHDWPKAVTVDIARALQDLGLDVGA